MTLKYALAAESELRSALLKIERRLEQAQQAKEKLLERLKNAGRLRDLLFENGKPLEIAILLALGLLGFRASQYKAASSEFDVVFECSEGRFLGEAEGKDSKPINVDKLRQLAMNINEDLQREEVSSPAKGVLFGNGYRLIPPAEREVQFTEKCITAAKSASTALLATTELFKAAKYLSDRGDVVYASQCRQSLLDGTGIVYLRDPPSADTSAPVASSEEIEQ